MIHVGKGEINRIQKQDTINRFIEKFSEQYFIIFLGKNTDLNLECKRYLKRKKKSDYGHAEKLNEYNLLLFCIQFIFLTFVRNKAFRLQNILNYWTLFCFHIIYKILFLFCLTRNRIYTKYILKKKTVFAVHFLLKLNDRLSGSITFGTWHSL